MSMKVIKLSLLFELKRYCHPFLKKISLNKCQSPSTVLALSPRHIKTPVRYVSTSWPKWKDVPQPKEQESEKLDLDIWKSVMRSQVAQEETSRFSGDGIGQKEAGEMSQEDSAVEATRELVEMWRQAGKQVPENITTEQLEIVAELSTKSAKKKYLKFLSIKEGYKKANKEKQTKKRMEWLEREEMNREEGEEGSKLRNTFILHFWQRSIDRLLGWQGIQAMRFGQPLVFDMNYESQMTPREIENTVSQLMETEGCNRRSVEPFHLHFCNLNPEGAYHKELLKRYGADTWENIMITSSPQRHIDMFPREQLVYLTADSPNVIHTFDHNKVYIIGALVDRSNLPGVSLATAKRLKLTTARLPLDEHLHWECGAKNLSLDQMFRILMTVKETGNWEEALKHVPQRKHSGFYTAKKGRNDSKGKEAKATPLANRESKDLFISKQFRGRGESKVPPQSLTAVLKRKVAARTAMAKKNWWED